MTSQNAVGLLMDPGLGKTSCVLSAFKILKEKGLVNRMLVIAPIRPMYYTWTSEIHKWADFNDLTFKILHGSDKNELLNGSNADILLINPEGLQWLLGKSLVKFNPAKLLQLGADMLVVDESTKFKHANTIRFKLLRKVLKHFKRRYILTGTVTPNGLLDLFGQIYILDLGKALGKYVTHYRNEFFYSPMSYFKWEPIPGAGGRIAELIRPLTIALKSEDYLQMPAKQYINLDVVLPEQAMRHYKEIEKEFFTVIENDVVQAQHAAIVGIKCRQIANGAVYVRENEAAAVHKAKLERLTELIDELSGDPLLILYEFRHDLKRIKEVYPDIPCLGSGISKSKEKELIKQFNAGELLYLIGHPASMGHGLNLQGSCNKVCWFGIPWNFEHYDQAIGRIYRQGQTKHTVFIYHIAAVNTLDFTVLDVLVQKERTQKDLLTALKSYNRRKK